MFPPRNKHLLRFGKSPVRLAAFLCVSIALSALSLAELDPVVSKSCIVKAPEAVLKFQYRIFPDVPVERITVFQDGKTLECRHTPFANNPLNTCAILVLVDTSIGSSRAPRDRTIEDNKEFIKALAANAQSRDLLGVSAFANDLVEVAPLGSDFKDIPGKIAHLKADGLGTRIYRQGMNAIEKLSAVPASRRALLILSDGKDEDSGFTMDDLKNMALSRGVMIFAMGCPETGMDIPGLGNLEKLASETRGLYEQARLGTPGPGERLKADTAFAQAVLASVNSGGEVVVPLDRIAPGMDVVFQLVGKDGKILRYVHKSAAVATPTPTPFIPPAVIPAVVTPATPTPTPTPVPATPSPTPKPSVAQTPVVKPPATPLEKSNDPAGKITIANMISGISVVLLVTAVVAIRRRKQKNFAPEIPVAFLEMLDSESKRILLTKAANRLGRNPGNEVVFANTSVSGFHAEIHRRRDGTFYIADLGSGNGLIVNEQRLSQSELKDGDLVELGEVRFRFFRC